MLSRLFYSGLRVTGITAGARAVRNGGVILAYHNVVARDDNVGDRGLHLALQQFSAQLSWLAGNYEIIPLTELARRLKAGQSVRRTAALTFDDAYEGVFENAWPLLKSAKLPATVFVPTDFIEHRISFWWDHPMIAPLATAELRQKWLEQLRGDSGEIARAEGALSAAQLPSAYRPASWQTIRRAAAEGLDLGVHSASHRNLTRLSGEELQREITDSRASIEAHTGVHASTFSFPYGLWNQRTRDSVKDAGFRAAVILGGGLNRPGADLWSLRRVNIPPSVSSHAFQAWVAGFSRD